MTMKIIYAREPIHKVLFLAGPTPRRFTPAPSWRPEAVQILEDLGYDGDVLIPEDSNGECKFEYDDQVDWETHGRNSSGVIVFWVPRDLSVVDGKTVMPAFTTNVEFGMDIVTRKILLGYPKEASKMQYLHKKADEYGIPVFHDLRQLLEAAVNKLNRTY